MRTSIVAVSRCGAFAAALLAFSLGLTGCGFQPAPDRTRERSSAPEEEDTRSPSSETPSTSAPSDTPINPNGDEPIPPREEAADGVERTVSCSNGSLSIADTGSVLRIDSDCAELTVSGSDTVVLAENVDTLKVAGMGLTVYVKRLDSVEVSGANNAVTWESGSPSISNAGAGNVLQPAS